MTYGKDFVIQAPFMIELNRVAITAKMCQFPCNERNTTIRNGSTATPSF